jgi:hypothetical protein
MKAQSAKIQEISYLEKIQQSTTPLADKLIESDNPEAIFYGLQLAESVCDENLFVGYGMYSQDGDVFTGRGNLVGTSSRLDRFYLQRQAKRARKDIERHLLPVKLKSDERWRFLTFTMPRLRECYFAKTIKVFDDAFKVLRDSSWWKKKVRAGVKSKEFTLGDEYKRENREWTFRDGYHVHGHFIVASKWIENRIENAVTGEKYFRELAEHWKIALEKSARKNKVFFEFNTVDSLPLVDVRLITNKGNKSGEISLTDAIAETAKYITKTDALKDLPIDQVLEISTFLKGKRMIEPLGEANARKGKGASEKIVMEPASESDLIIKAPDAETDTSVLHTETIERFSRLKRESLELIQDGRIDEARRLIHRTFEKRRAFRRRQLCFYYPTAEFMTLSGESFTLDDYSSYDLRAKFKD